VASLKEENIANQEKLTCSELFEIIAPNMPNEKSLLIGDESFKKITQRKIQLSDRTVSALIYEDKEDPRDRVYFVYDDFLVWVHVLPDEVNDEWFKQFSLEKRTQ
jgi:hypothetical protein